MGVLWRKMGKGVVPCWPHRTRFYFWGFYVCVNFGKNRSRNATVGVRMDGYTHWQTHWQTQTGFLQRCMECRCGL